MEEATREEQTLNNDDVINALEKLTASNDQTTKAVQSLQEYLVAKDREEKQQAETLKKQEEQEAKKQAELDEQEAKEVESAEAEQQASADQQNETYTELLTSINDQLVLQNSISAGSFFTSGILCGVLLLTIFWNRLK